MASKSLWVVSISADPSEIRMPDLRPRKPQLELDFVKPYVRQKLLHVSPGRTFCFQTAGGGIRSHIVGGAEIHV